jgi:hypothetical protein
LATGLTTSSPPRTTSVRAVSGRVERSAEIRRALAQRDRDKPVDPVGVVGRQPLRDPATHRRAVEVRTRDVPPVVAVGLPGDEHEQVVAAPVDLVVQGGSVGRVGEAHAVSLARPAAGNR